MKSLATFTALKTEKTVSYTFEDAAKVKLSSYDTLLSKVMGMSLHNHFQFENDFNNYFSPENTENYSIEVGIVNSENFGKSEKRFFHNRSAICQICEKVGNEIQNIIYLKRKTIPKIKK